MDKYDLGESMPVEQFRMQLKEIHMVRMNIPQNLWHVKVQGIEASVQQIFIQYLIRLRSAMKLGTGLLICGPVGTGKTSAAIVVAKEARSIGLRVSFYPIWELREAIRAKIEYEDGVPISERCKLADVVIFDDLTAEDAKAPIVNESTLANLIKYRSGNKKISIVTTTLSLKEMSSSLPILHKVCKEALFPVGIVGRDRHDDREREMAEFVLGTSGSQKKS